MMTPKTSKSKKSSSGTTTLTTQAFLNRNRTAIIQKAVVVHETFKNLGARWEVIYQENRSAWTEQRQGGCRHLSTLVSPLWQAANLLATRFQRDSGVFADAFGKSDGYKITKLLKSMEEDAKLLESILSNLEREMTKANKKKAESSSKAAPKKKKKAEHNMTKSKVEV